MKEFDELMKKYIRFKDYEQNKFAKDTPANQDLAVKGFQKLIKEMSVYWDMMSESQKQKYIDLL